MSVEVKPRKESDRNFIVAFQDIDKKKQVEVREGETIRSIEPFGRYTDHRYLENFEFLGWGNYNRDTDLFEYFDFDQPIRSNLSLSSNWVARNNQNPEHNQDYEEKIIDKILNSQKFNDFIDKKLLDRFSEKWLIKKNLNLLKKKSVT